MRYKINIECLLCISSRIHWKSFKYSKSVRQMEISRTEWNFVVFICFSIFLRWKKNMFYLFQSILYPIRYEKWFFQSCYISWALYYDLVYNGIWTPFKKQYGWWLDYWKGDCYLQVVYETKPNQTKQWILCLDSFYWAWTGPQ